MTVSDPQLRSYALPVRAERIFIWSGLGMVVCLLVGLWPLAGFIPPPAPAGDAAYVARIYAANANGIIGGSLLVMTGAGFFLLFCLAVSAAMERHDPDCALLSRAQMICAAINAVLFIFVGLFWTAGAYRLDAEPTEIRLFNDIAWIIMVVPVVPFMFQLLAVGAVVLFSPRASGLPRWLGYFNVWCALAVIPGSFSGFFKTGPIAWNGILSFWLEGAVFLLWLVVMCPALLRALGGRSDLRTVSSVSTLAYEPRVDMPLNATARSRIEVRDP